MKGADKLCFCLCFEGGAFKEEGVVAVTSFESLGRHLTLTVIGRAGRRPSLPADQLCWRSQLIPLPSRGGSDREAKR